MGQLDVAGIIHLTSFCGQHLEQRLCIDDSPQGGPLTGMISPKNGDDVLRDVVDAVSVGWLAKRVLRERSRLHRALMSPMRSGRHAAAPDRETIPFATLPREND
jgi:hypothetical protein